MRRRVRRAARGRRQRCAGATGGQAATAGRQRTPGQYRRPAGAGVRPGRPARCADGGKTGRAVRAGHGRRLDPVQRLARGPGARVAEARPPGLGGLFQLSRDEDTRRGLALVLRTLQGLGRQLGDQRQDYAAS
ncbi:DUF1641 domain-containing protein [Achromobacter xylosoxidans]